MASILVELRILFLIMIAETYNSISKRNFIRLHKIEYFLNLQCYKIAKYLTIFQSLISIRWSWKKKNAVEKIGVTNIGIATAQNSQCFKTSFLDQCFEYKPACKW